MKVESPVVTSLPCERYMEVEERPRMVIFGVDLMTETLEPLINFELFLTKDLDSPPIFEKIQIPWNRK